MAPDLATLREQWRVVARYGITRHRLANNGFYCVHEPVPEYTGLTYDEGNRICERLNLEAWNAAGRPWSTFGVTSYTLTVETPLPKRWTPSSSF
jgi:hypothetical protein